MVTSDMPSVALQRGQGFCFCCIPFIGKFQHGSAIYADFYTKRTTVLKWGDLSPRVSQRIYLYKRNETKESDKEGRTKKTYVIKFNFSKKCKTLSINIWRYIKVWHKKYHIIGKHQFSTGGLGKGRSGLRKFFDGGVRLRFSIGYPWLRKFWPKTYPWLRSISWSWAHFYMILRNFSPQIPF